MYRDLLTKLKQIKHNRVEAETEDSGGIQRPIQAHTDGIKKAKAHLDVNLSWHIKSNNKTTD